MIKRSKLVYILGSIIIGIISVVFIFAGLILTGVIDSSSKKLVLVSLSNEPVYYSGQTFTYEEWELRSGELKEGHTLTVTFTGEQLNAGKSENTFTATVFDANGADVSGDYEIEYTFGDLTVNPRPLTVTTATGSREYDGVEFRVEKYTYVGELVSGDALSCEFSKDAGITDVGKQENVAAAKIVNADGEDVTVNYAVEIVYGELSVTKREIILEAPGEAKPYDGTPLVYECEDPVKELVKGGSLVDGHTLVPTFYKQVTTVEEGEVANDFTAVIMSGERDVTGNYGITYKEPGKLKVTPYNALLINTGTAQRTYNGESLTLAANAWSFAENYENMFTEGDFEGYSMQLEYPEITEVKDSVVLDVEAIDWIIRNKAGEDVTESFTVEVYEAGLLKILPFELRIITDGGEKMYDGTPLRVDSWHWENEANPFEDTENYPKLAGYRAEIETTGEQTNAWTATFNTEKGETEFLPIGVSDNGARLIAVKNAAGIEVSSDNFEFEVVEKGQLSVTPRTLSLRSDSVETVYNGSEQRIKYLVELGESGLAAWSATTDDWYYAEWSYEGGDGVVAGEKIRIEFEQSFKDVSEDELGYALNGTVCVLDTDDNEIGYGELNYQIDTSAFGRVKINPYVVEIGTEDFTSEYNGESQTPDDSYWYYADAEAEDFMAKLGHTLRINLTSARNVCEIENVLAAVENGELPYSVKEGEVDKTRNYVVTAVRYGSFTITPRTLVVGIDGGSKLYDGEALMIDTWEWVKDDRVRGEEIDFFNFPSISTGKEKKKNTPEYTINDDNGGKNYQVIFEYGENDGYLEITQIELWVHTVDLSWEYDGQIHGQAEYEEDDLWILDEGNTLEGHTVKGTPLGIEVQDVDDPRENTVIFSILRDGEVFEDWDDCYDINPTQGEGKLSVYPREIELTSHDHKLEYSGTEFSCEGCEEPIETIGDLAEGHTWIFEQWESVLDAGEKENRFQAYVYDEYTGDPIKASNYTLTCTYGKLTVLPRTLTILDQNVAKVYDGTPLTGAAAGKELEIENMADGHTATADYLSEVTTVSEGEVRNYVLLTFQDANQEPVNPNNYDYDEDCGTLKIYPRRITVESGSDSKFYDGSPLSCSEYTVRSPYGDTEAEALGVAGYRIDAPLKRSITAIGQIDNAFDYIEICDEAGNPVTDNYDINELWGVLTVMPATDVQAAVYSNGSRLDSDDLATDEMNAVVAQVRNANGGTVYLRLKSEGNYTGTGWSAVSEEYDKTLEDSYGMNYLTGYALRNTYDSEPQTLEIRLNQNVGYLLPYYLDMSKDYDYKTQNTDVYQYGNFYDIYTVGYLPFDVHSLRTFEGLSVLAKGDEYYNAEIGYRTWVKKNYLTVDDSLAKNYLQNIIDEYGWQKLPTAWTGDIGKFDVIFEVADYIRNAATYALNYPSALDDSEDIIYDFLATHKKGVCRHYASAATLLLRMLGIPARYTVGYRVDTVAGESTEVSKGDAHAWVEVYVYGVGWIQLEVTGGGASSSPIYQKRMIVKPVDVVQKYEAGMLPIRASDYVLENTPTWWDENYTIEVAYSGSLSEPGIAESSILKFIIKDGDGNEIPYTPIFRKGKLQLYRNELTITSKTGSKEYDGTPLTKAETEEVGSEGLLAEGHELVYTFTGSQTEFGVSENAFTVRVMEGENDVTDQYRINTEFGTLTVEKAKLDLMVLNDGTVLIVNGELGEGQSIVAIPTETGSGYTLDMQTVRVFAGNEDVTENYTLTDVTENYKLTVV